MVKLQEAVKKETAKIVVVEAVMTAIMMVVMIALKFIFSGVSFFNSIKIPNVILGGICGAVITVVNFFLMAVTVQYVTGIEDEKAAKQAYQKSYYRRLGIQLLWIVAAFLAPVFNPAAGILPLFFPGFAIKVLGILQGSAGDTVPAATSAENVENKPATEENKIASYKEV